MNSYGGETGGINEWYGHTQMLMGNGKIYDNFIVMWPQSSSAANQVFKEYKLHGKYSLFTAVVGVARSSNGCELTTDGNFTVNILIDGVVKYSRSGYDNNGIGSYDYVYINITGASKLRLETYADGDRTCDEPVFADPLLTCGMCYVDGNIYI